MKNFKYICSRTTAIIMLLVTMGIFVTSCQKDKIVVQNPPPEQAIEAGSALVDLMRTMSSNDTAVDNNIDNTSCSSIQFPFTVVTGGIEITINAVEDLAIIQQLIDDNNGMIDIEILFPITIVLPDYSTIVIENQDEFDLFIASCDPGPNECVDFAYPISFSVFDVEFELIETVVIASDIELFFFLQELDGANGNIISLNFPVSLNYDNGTTIAVNTNDELAAAIEAGPDNCEDSVDPENPCPASLIEDYLLECYWQPTLYAGDDLYEFYNFTFNEDDEFELQTSNSFNIFGVWNLYEEEDNQTYIEFENNTPLFEPFNGTWSIISCSETEILIENAAGIQIQFTRNCGPNFAECYGSGQGICDDDNDGFVPVDIGELINSANCNDSLQFSINFYETNADAYTQTNPLPPSIYTTTIAGAQVLYYSVVDTSTNELLYVAEFEIIAENCGGCNNPGLLTDDLIVYVPFGNEVKDLITDQELDHGGQLVEDRAGNSNCAIGFIDGDDPVLIPNTANNWLEPNDDFTISIWFKMQNDVAGDYEEMFRTQAPGTGGMSLAVYDLNTPLFSTEIAPQINLWDNDWNQEVDVEWTNTDWHHLVITHENNITRLYRDGILRNESQTDVDLGIAGENGYQLSSTSPTGNFVGHLDDFRLYNRALNPNEVNTLFTLDADCFTCLD